MQAISIVVVSNIGAKTTISGRSVHQVVAHLHQNTGIFQGPPLGKT